MDVRCISTVPHMSKPAQERPRTAAEIGMGGPQSMLTQSILGVSQVQKNHVGGRLPAGRAATQQWQPWWRRRTRRRRHWAATPAAAEAAEGPRAAAWAAEPAARAPLRPRTPPAVPRWPPAAPAKAVTAARPPVWRSDGVRAVMQRSKQHLVISATTTCNAALQSCLAQCPVRHAGVAEHANTDCVH